jgi:hypothetical protein
MTRIAPGLLSVCTGQRYRSTPKQVRGSATTGVVDALPRVAIPLRRRVYTLHRLCIPTVAPSGAFLLPLR